MLAFNRAIVDATADVAACFKVQIACYKTLGIEGFVAHAGALGPLRGVEVGMPPESDAKTRIP